MMIRIKIIEENVMGRRGAYFKWRSSQKFCKVDGFKTSKLKLHPNHKFTPGDVSHYYVSWANPRVIKQFLYYVNVSAFCTINLLGFLIYPEPVA